MLVQSYNNVVNKKIQKKVTKNDKALCKEIIHYNYTII